MKKKILVVDDNDAILETVGIILEENGYDVLTRSDAHALKRDIQKFTPDLIFLDVWLKGQDGIRIAKELKENKKTCEIPIVMISAASHIEKRLSESKADDFIAKPFELADLVKKARIYA
jgi:DNA-binding response OmpR family regulator